MYSTLLFEASVSFCHQNESSTLDFDPICSGNLTCESTYIIKFGEWVKLMRHRFNIWKRHLILNYSYSLQYLSCLKWGIVSKKEEKGTDTIRQYYSNIRKELIMFQTKSENRAYREKFVMQLLLHKLALLFPTDHYIRRKHQQRGTRHLHNFFE